MKTNHLIYVWCVLILGFMAGCKEDESLFSGEENYIASFRLVQGTNSYAGRIVGDSLILAVPENVSFENAVVEFTASENAVLEPEPSTITDWRAERTFTVTSYNQTPRVYRYLVVRTLAAQVGDVVLTTPEEIEAFASKGINRIEGNLVIGKFVGTVKEDTLTSLALLSALKEVTGKVTIHPTYGGTSLDGLQSLEKVGGFTMVGRSTQYGAFGLTGLKEIDLSNLKKVGSNLSISADTLYMLNLSALESVGGDFTLETQDVREMDLSALQIVVGKFSCPGRNGNMLFPERLEVPRLGTVGGAVEIKNSYRLKELLFPVLTSAGGISLEQTGPLEKVELGQLREVVDQLTLQWTHRVKEYDLSRLQSVGGFKVYFIQDLEKLNLPNLNQVGAKGLTIEHCNNLKDLELSALTGVQGNLSLPAAVTDVSTLKEVWGNFTYSPNVENFDGFNHLVRVGGDFTLNGGTAKAINGFKALASIKGTITLIGMDNVERIDGFDVLKSVGSGLIIRSMPKLETISFLSNLRGAHFTRCEFYKLSALQSLDVSGSLIDRLTLDEVGADFVLRGQTEFEGEMVLNNSRGVRFEGIEHVQTLIVSCFVQEKPTVFNFTNLKKVGKLSTKLGFSANAAAMCFPDLEEVEGTLDLSEGMSSVQMQPTQFPALRKVGALTYTGVISVLNLPVLENVDGEFRISTSYQNGPVKMLEEIRVPNLKRVGGLVLTSNAYSANNYNNVITDLKCFGTLENADYINIQKQAGLVSFEGLEKVISKLEDEGTWVVSENGYNPTFEQVKEGELVK